MTIQEYAKVYQTETDKQLIQASATGWMDKNSTLVKYNGGNEVKVPYITVNGYKDYDRANGYKSGASTFNYETHQFDMDRGIKFVLDSQDVDETNFGATTANLLKEFNDTEAIPEKDAYRLSKVFSNVPADNKDTATLTEANILSKVKELISRACSKGIEPGNLVLQITWEAYNTLTMSDKIFRMLNTKEMSVADGIKLNFKTLDETIIIPTASSRMKTEYDFWTGDTSADGEADKNGFSPKSTACQINFMVIPANAPIAITKCDKFKIIDPASNQNADAWIVASRVYHTLIMTNRKAQGCYVNYQNGDVVSIATASYTASDDVVFSKTGNISVNGTAITVNGVISEGSDGAKAYFGNGDTHFINIKFTKQGADFTEVKYQVSGRSVVTEDPDFDNEEINYILGMKSGDTQFDNTLTIFWDGVTATTYSFVFGDIILA